MAAVQCAQGFRRGKRRQFATGPAMIWVSQSGRVCVERFQRSNAEGRRNVFYVQQRRETAHGVAWDKVSFHWKKSAAFKAARRLDQRLGKAK